MAESHHVKETCRKEGQMSQSTCHTSTWHTRDAWTHQSENSNQAEASYGVPVPCQCRSHFRRWGPPTDLHQGELEPRGLVRIWGYSLVTGSPVREGQPKATQKEKLNWGSFLSSRHCYRVRIHGFLSEKPSVHPTWWSLTWKSQDTSHYHIIIYTITSGGDNPRDPWTLVGRGRVPAGTVWQHNTLTSVHLAEMKTQPHKNWLIEGKAGDHPIVHQLTDR